MEIAREKQTWSGDGVSTMLVESIGRRWAACLPG